MIVAVLALAALPFSALVVDENGEPLEDVWVLPAEGQLTTGANGRVAGRTTSALLAFRKREYQAAIVAPREGLTVVMRRTGPELPLPRCGKPGDGWTFQVRGPERAGSFTTSITGVVLTGLRRDPDGILFGMDAVRSGRLAYRRRAIWSRRRSSRS